MVALGAMLFGCAAGDEPGVYLVNVGDGESRRVGDLPAIPVWSPSGDALIWAGEDGLFRREIDEQFATRLWTGPIAGRPAWSPDGGAIAFVDRTRASLLVLSLQSGDILVETPMANPVARFQPLALPTLGGPAWAPDGTRLAFACWDGAGDEICTIGADGRGRRQVTRIEPPTSGAAPADFVPASSNVGPPAWSPDSSSLAMAVYPERSGAVSGVFVVDLKRGTARRVSPLHPTSEVLWTPQGSSLIFAASDKGRVDVFRISVGDHASENLTESLPGGAFDPTLSPDGSELAVSSEGAILVLGSGSTVLELAKSSLAERYPAWSPLGEAIAYAADANPITTYD